MGGWGSLTFAVSWDLRAHVKFSIVTYKLLGDADGCWSQDHNLRTTVLNQPLKGLGWIVAFLEEIKEILLGPFQPKDVYSLFAFISPFFVT